MKILVMCPGSFTHGLDSPERGEGRWAQNYARMLAQAGHDVYAASGGLRGNTQTHYGVKLIDQNPIHCQEHGPYDLFIDSAWWKDKVPAAEAKKYIILKWAPEDYLRFDPLPENTFIGYPYISHRYNFSGPKFGNEHKAFPMPTMFCQDFSKPNWQANKIFIPGKIDTNRPYQRYMNAIATFLSAHPVEGRSRKFFETHFQDKIDFAKPFSNWTESTPYDQVVQALGRSRISLPILNPGCVIEAACAGVPSIMWEHGGFFNPLAQQLNISIAHDAPPERFTEVAHELFYNQKTHAEVTMAMQDAFSGHTFSGSLKYFNHMMDSIQ